MLAGSCPPGDNGRALLAGLMEVRGRARWPALASTEFGAIGLNTVLEACGATLAPNPMVSSVGMAAGVLKLGGHPVDGALADGGAGAVATSAAQSGEQALPITLMRLEGGRLRGCAVQVPDLTRADLIVTLALSGEVGLVALVRPGDGVRITESTSADPLRPLADLECEAVPKASASLGIESALVLPLLAADAELIGVASGALPRACEPPAAALASAAVVHAASADVANG